MNRVLLLLGLMFAVAGCGGGSSKVSLAFVSNNPEGFWVYAEKGCQKAAKELDIDLQFRRPAKGTANLQKDIIQELMIKGVKGIAISPNDPGNFVTFLKEKVSAKIPLITQDNDVPDPSVRRCYIGTHNYRAGRAAGALVKKAIPAGGKIAIFVGQMDATNAIERRQGVLDYLAGIDQDEIKDKTPADAQNVHFGKYILVETRTDDASATTCQQKAAELLLIHADLACLVGLWEYNPPALLRAVRSSQKKPAIVGFDENFETLEAIRKNEIVGTVVQNPYQFGYESIKILAGLAKGDDSVLKGRSDIDDQNRIYIPHRIVVKDPGNEKIANSETVDVEVFYPEMKKLRDEI